MHRPVGAAAPTAPGAFAAAAAPIAVNVGDTVIYKGSRGVVRFFGATSFAQGMWTGLEMLEGVDGIHDGTSSVDKKRYFTCPRGRGVFVRPSQLKAAA
jgi:dynactin complex subunit